MSTGYESVVKRAAVTGLVIVVFLLVNPRMTCAVDIECRFSGEWKATVYKDLVFGENITVKKTEDGGSAERQIYWGDDFVTIIVESAGTATLVVVNRNTLSATKRVSRAGISPGEAKGTCRLLGNLR